MKYNVFRIGKYVYVFTYMTSNQLYNCSYCAFYNKNICSAKKNIKHYCKDNAYYRRII